MAITLPDGKTIDTNISQFEKTFQEVNANITSGSVIEKTVKKIHDIIFNYIKTRLYDNKSLEYKLDKVLLQQFEKDIKNAIIEHIKTNDEFIDIDGLITEIKNEISIDNSINDKTNQNIDNIISEIISVCQVSLKKVVLLKIKNEIKSKIKIVDIINKNNKLRVNNKIIESQINDVILKNNINVIDQKKVNHQRIEYRNKIINLYKTELLDNINKRRYNENKSNNDKIPTFSLFTLFSKKRQIQLKQLNDNIRKRAGLLTSELVNILKFGIIEFTFNNIKRYTKFILNIPKYVSKAVIKSVKYLVNNTIIRGVFSIASTLMRITLGLFTKPFSLIFNLSKFILINIKKLAKRFKLSNLLITPAGMYAVGFILGFLWQKLKKFLNIGDGTVGSIKDVIDFLYNKVLFIEDKIYQLYELYDNMKSFILDKYNDFISKHPNIREFIEDINTKGFGTALSNGIEKIERKTINFYNNIKDSWWFNTIEVVYDSIINLSTFMLNHPILATLIAELPDIYSTFRSLNMFIPKGFFLKGITGALVGYAITSTTDSIFKLFSNRSDNALDFTSNKLKNIIEARSFLTSNTHIQSSLEQLSKEDREKANRLLSYAEDTQSFITNGYNVLDILNKVRDNNSLTVSKYSVQHLIEGFKQYGYNIENNIYDIHKNIILDNLRQNMEEPLKNITRSAELAYSLIASIPDGLDRINEIVKTPYTTNGILYERMFNPFVEKYVQKKQTQALATASRVPNIGTPGFEIQVPLQQKQVLKEENMDKIRDKAINDWYKTTNIVEKRKKAIEDAESKVKKHSINASVQKKHQYYLQFANINQLERINSSNNTEQINTVIEEIRKKYFNDKQLQINKSIEEIEDKNNEINKRIHDKKNQNKTNIENLKESAKQKNNEFLQRYKERIEYIEKQINI